MQRVSNDSQPNRRRISMRARAMAPGAVAATLLIGRGAMAQDSTPEASPVADTAEATVTTLFSYELDSFPAAPVSVRLLRMILEPGASSPMHIHPGPEFDYVVSGSLTVNSQGEATVVGANGNEVTRTLGADVLTAGDLVVFPAGVGMNLVNNGGETLVLLSSVFHPITEEGVSTTYPDGNPPADAFDGLSYEVLGDGQVQTFPTGTTEYVLDEIEAPATVALPGLDGASLYSLVSGDFGFTVDSGSVQVSRTASPGLRPNAAPEQEFMLATADAAFFPAGLDLTSRSDQTSELAILRLSAISSEPLSLEPAVITFLPPPAVPDLPVDGEFTEIAIGAVVRTTSGSLNLRAEPSTSADSIAQLSEGVELTVIGGPEEADDYTWWQVEGVFEESDVEGWLADEFLELVSVAVVEEPEASPQATPGATPTAEVAFSEGDIVALSEVNVRVREEATVDSEPIDVFDEGTEFEVTGAPVEADDYIWFPVTLVSDASISGWVVGDFLVLVED